MGRLSDTSPEADQVFTEVFRKMSLGQKWQKLGRIYADAKLLHAAGVRLRKPDATPRDVHEEWLRINLGFTLRDRIRDPAGDRVMENTQTILEVAAVFDSLGIPYALGGSVASSLYGISRHTLDADITVEPFPGKEADFVGALGPDYYVSLPAVQQGVRAKSSFNVINTSAGFKVDVFIRKDEPFEQSAMARRVPTPVPGTPNASVVLYTPEDVILFKLRWYRLGNEVAEQWKDVLGVLKVQAGKLDEAYLDHWAAELSVADLLERARAEAA
jgi:hypothetical protein